MADARANGVLFSLHLKATMMKVSDPIIFGHAVRAYFADVFDRYGDELRAAGADPDGGLGSVLSALLESVAHGPGAVAAARATRTIPIVFTAVPWPVETGLIDSFARPGRNVTGVSNYTGMEVSTKRLEFLKEIAPTATRAVENALRAV